MPRLILLNGPPAAGKSTLARLYADQHPPALNLDIDAVRAMIGGWRENPAAGLQARAVALAAARVHLTAGHDVVVPQLVGRLDFIGQLESVARDCAAEFHEVFLLPDEQGALLQYRERARLAAELVSPDPAISADQTAADLARTYVDMLDVLAARPAAAVVHTQPGRVAEAYQAVLASLARGETPDDLHGRVETVANTTPITHPRRTEAPCLAPHKRLNR